MKNVMLSPGSMGVAAHAIDLFGLERVAVGGWATPVWVEGLSEDEIEFAREYFSELGISILEVDDNRQAKKFLCRWCAKTFESEYGAFCTHCQRFQTNTANPNLPEPLNEK